MPYQIDFQINIEGADVPEDRLRAAITHVLDLHEVDRSSGLTVVVTDDHQVQTLNASMRAVDAPTDILSFPADPAPALPDDPDFEVDSDELRPYLGDLVIAYPYSRHQAAEAGHALSDELTLLVIHGTLHLIGYDHDAADSEAEMWTTQAEALAAFAVPITVPRFHPDAPDMGDLDPSETL